MHIQSTEQFSTKLDAQEESKDNDISMFDNKLYNQSLMEGPS